jgi:hypothetical protein
LSTIWNNSIRIVVTLATPGAAIKVHRARAARRLRTIWENDTASTSAAP